MTRTLKIITVALVTFGYLAFSQYMDWPLPGPGVDVAEMRGALE